MIASGALLLTNGPTLLKQIQGATTSTTPADDASLDKPSVGYIPVTTPNGSTLPWRRLVDGVKVFHLIAEPVKHHFADGLAADCWGYNGSTPGPTIEAVEGERVRIYATNRLPAPTTVHWHGLRIPNGMDGVNGLTQVPIPPGETFKYEFTLRDFGTFMYHPHFDEMTQQGMGMMGMFIVHPRDPKMREQLAVDRDFAIMLSEWRITPGTSRPNPIEMTDFNILTMNSKVYPATDPLVVRKGQRVRIRFGNLSAMDHHPIHLHGFQFKIAETDGGRVPEAAQIPANSVLVPVGSTRAVEFVADAEGDWSMHCHMTHHTMNQMGHNVPNMVGVKEGDLDAKINRLLPGYMTMGQAGMGDMSDMNMPGPKNSIAMLGGKGPYGAIDMGGMFTLLKFREGITTYNDPGFYKQPPGTVAIKATAEEIRRDGIDLG
jgi:FtsP/CotA-like multicopper oxidase with cupredoxin domain